MVKFDYPETVEQAVERLTAYFPLSDRVFISNLGEKDLPTAHSILAPIMRDELGVLSGNRALINACRQRTGDPDLSPEETLSFLIRLFWETLRKTHALRVVRSDDAKS